uniref:VWFA domain-containing protein n=1 Tax=Rhodosorus marinus TaxID=101924 RepID=A0A7S2ZVD5_9RHOD|mmetsp:Transcript_32470/g.127350  ORF Transcript_32470/g.127350 Transcript_32470/m.127350 type:complete len:354 (+) Transcript_32470:757-1818(+)
MSRRQLDIDKDDEFTREEQEAKKKKGYAWESQDRSWERIQEDESGRIRAVGADDPATRRQRRQALIPGIKRGIVRYAVLAIDASESMNDSDMKPSRGIAVLTICEQFVQEFFEQNPIAHLAIVATFRGSATQVAAIGSSPQALCSELSTMAEKASFRGEASLQNLLELSKAILDPVPPYGSKEVIMVFSSLSTTDPGDIKATTNSLKENGIRCSIVGLAAEVYILRQVCKKTGGEYHVATNEEHFHELVNAHVPPPPLASDTLKASLVEMGFPKLKVLKSSKQYFDANVNPKGGRSSGKIGYECPRCKSWLSDVPVECVLCGLTLITSPHLARSYHHLFPIPAFKEVTATDTR